MQPQQRKQPFIVRDDRRQLPPNKFHHVPMPEPGFLAGEVQSPAFDPRTLLRSGDIETNPGPACDYCKKEFSSVMCPLECGVTGCGRQCHRQRKCSRISATEQWFCDVHKTEAPPVAACDECGKTLTSSQAKSARKCAVRDCPKLCHRGKKCSRISRYAVDGVWKCLAHSGRRPRQRQNQQKSNDSVPCANKSCKLKKIYGHLFKYECSKCKGNFHGSFTDMSRDVREKFKLDPSMNVLICQPCLSKLAVCSPKKPEITEDVNESAGRRLSLIHI